MCLLWQQIHWMKTWFSYSKALYKESLDESEAWMRLWADQIRLVRLTSVTRYKSFYNYPLSSLLTPRPGPPTPHTPDRKPTNININIRNFLCCKQDTKSVTIRLRLWSPEPSCHHSSCHWPSPEKKYLINRDHLIFMRVWVGFDTRKMH